MGGRGEMGGKEGGRRGKVSPYKVILINKPSYILALHLLLIHDYSTEFHLFPRTHPQTYFLEHTHKTYFFLLS